MEQDILKLENQICFRFYSTTHNLTRLYTPLLKKFNLTYPQYIVMLVLFEEEVIDFGDLAKKVDLKLATLTPIVKRLDELGYAHRRFNESDKRKKNIHLSSKGKVLRNEIVEVPLKLVELLNMDLETYLETMKKLDGFKSSVINALERIENEEHTL